MEQGEVPGKDAPTADDVLPEPKPFPKVGDVVRYMGKWENEISLGEVRQCPKHVCASILKCSYFGAAAIPALSGRAALSRVVQSCLSDSTIMRCWDLVLIRLTSFVYLVVPRTSLPRGTWF